MNNGEFLNQALHQVTQVHLECLHELEQYCYYIARCLGKNFNMNEIVRVQFENPKGMTEAIVYPKSSVVDGQGIVNPMFCFGYCLKITEQGIQLQFTEDYNEFQQKKH